jgi:hypothetical protein
MVEHTGLIFGNLNREGCNLREREKYTVLKAEKLWQKCWKRINYDCSEASI